MKKVRLVALVCAGPISRTGLARLPRLAGQLGPVKAGSLRVASRVVNSLGGGSPVESYEELANSRLILLSLPLAQLGKTEMELAASGLQWAEKSVALYDSPVESTELTRLRAAGASTASFGAVEGSQEKRYVVEGDPVAVRALKALIENDSTRMIELERGCKSQYLAGVTLTTTVFTPLIASAAACFRLAGLKPGQTEATLDALLLNTVRSYFKAGSRAWSEPPAEELARQAASLESKAPELAARFRSAAQ
ncbi:MAG: hypothetical protein ACRD7E_19120, partial [Bryobacteraceae bacterium]